jgi:hypothetical protein
LSRNRVEVTAAALVLVVVERRQGGSLRERNTAREQRDIAQAPLVQIRSRANPSKNLQSLSTPAVPEVGGPRAG